MNFSQLKGLFLKTMLACLIGAAGVAVFSILAGSFNEVAGRSLATILLVAIHCLISFGFIVNNEKQDTFDNLAFFTNVVFGLIILRFITSTLGVWTVISGSLVLKLYGLYFVLLFATLHGEILSKMRGKQSNIDGVVSFNYVFMAVVVVMLVPVIFIDDSMTILGSYYYRVLAAAGVIDATLTLTAVILHKLYLRAHPEVTDNVFSIVSGSSKSQGDSTERPHHMNIFVVLLLGYIGFQVLSGVVFLAVAMLNQP